MKFFPFALFLLLAVGCLPPEPRNHNPEIIDRLACQLNGPVYSFLGDAFYVDENGARQYLDSTVVVPAWLPVESGRMVFNQEGLLTNYSREYKEDSDFHWEDYQIEYSETGLPATMTLDASTMWEEMKVLYLFVDRRIDRQEQLSASSNHVIGSIEYFYDDRGRLKRQTEYWESDSFRSRRPDAVTHYTYPNNYVEVEEYYSKEEGRQSKGPILTHKIIRTFDRQGRVIEEKVDAIEDGTRRFVYNEQNQILVEKYFNAIGQLLRSWTYTYDAFGNVLQFKFWDKEEEGYSYRCEYLFDEQQNWTEKKVYLGEEAAPDFVLTRQYFYYKF